MGALTRIRKFLSQEQTKHLSDGLKYYPLIWVFSGKTENRSINTLYKHTHHRCSLWRFSVGVGWGWMDYLTSAPKGIIKKPDFLIFQGRGRT